MKLKFILSTLFVSLVASGCSSHDKEGTPSELGGAAVNAPSYLGQKVPGLTPKVFAPGIVSTEHRDLSGFFSPDMTEFFFTRKDNDTNKWQLIGYKYKDNQWVAAGIEPRVGRPFISPNGQVMHLGKQFKERTESGWSEIKSLGPSYEDIRIMRLTSSLNGTYVFDEGTRDGSGILRYSRVVDGKRQAPKPLSKSINTGKWNAHPFIAPDESYILWDSEREGGYGDNDIYISFKQLDGSWSEAVNLGDRVNSSAQESGAYVTPDGKYLFFNSSNAEGNRDIYWVDAKFLETLRPKRKSLVSEVDFPTFKGAYLGQKPPGKVAEPFAPNIISTQGWELEGVFAPGMKEFYYTVDARRFSDIEEKRLRATVIGYRQEGNVWKKFVDFPRRGEVVFSPDGNRMHMAKGYRDREGKGWSQLQSLGPMFDRKDWGIMRLSASANGTYVFDDYRSNDELRISRVVDGKRQAPKKMGPNINTGKWTAHPFIAADESYLIWDSEREGGHGNTDLYISFKQPDGSWGPAINMGPEINSDKSDFYASVTPDGKYILFNRTINSEARDIDIYWVDAQIIETLRAANATEG